MLSLIASDSEVVKHTGHFLRCLRLQPSYRVYSMLSDVEVVGRPSLEVVDVLLPSHLNHQVGLLAIDLLKDFAEGEPHFISIMMMKLVHIKGKVREHLIVELVEVFILLGILTVDFPQDIAEDHEHASFIEHVLNFLIDLLAGKEVESLADSDKIVFLVIADGCNAILFENNLAVRMPFYELINLCLGYAKHLGADVNSFGVWEEVAETEQNLACANCDIKVLLSLLEGLQGILPQLQRVLRAIFLIIDALSLKPPDVHLFLNQRIIDNWRQLNFIQAQKLWTSQQSITPQFISAQWATFPLSFHLP